MIEPEKLRFTASMGASDRWRSLPDVRAFRDADEAPASTAASRSPAPSGPLLVELEWSDLFDQIPDSASTAIAWLSLDGEVTQYDDLEPVGSPLTGSVAAKRVLRQRAEDVSSYPLEDPRTGQRPFRGARRADRYHARLRADGIGQLDDVALFDELLGLMRTGDRRLVEAGSQHRSRLWAAAAATAASIYIAERATDPGLEAAAIELADAFHDHAMTRMHRQRRGDVEAADRRAFRGMAREILVGFAW